MEKNEKRSRKRSRKVSESEQAQEEPPSPVGKTRRRSATGRFAPAEETSGRAISSRTRNKVLKVSFDILENNLNVGDAAEGVNGSQCSLTLASAPENTPTPGTENHENRIRPGNGAGSKNKRDIVRKSPEIKFKNNNFNFSYLSSNKKRSWKSYKQIVTAERALPWRPSDVTFSSLDAPPLLKPAKKYADLSGLRAKYRDPMSGLLFSSTEEFRTIRSLPPDIITGYLALHGKTPIM